MSHWNVSPRTLGVLAWLVICSPIWVYLADAGSFGRMQHNDYYAIVGDLTDGEELTRDPWRWLNLKSNEHRATLPVLAYALNIALTDGHNLGLTAFALLLLTIVLVLLVGLLPEEVRSDSRTRVAFGFVLALFCFTPVAAHNVAMGFSGTIWFFANALAVAAIAVLVRRSGSGRALDLWPVLALGLAAAFSHSTHLVLWPTLVAGGVFLRLSWRRLLLLGAGLGLVMALFALSYEPLGYHPDANTRDLRVLLRYAGAYLGSLFSGELATARAIGLAGIAACLLFGLLAVVLTRSRASLRADLAPWLMIQAYGLGNALMTAVGRSGFGEGQALSSRYASLAALFWMGLLTPAAFLAWRWRPAKAPPRTAVAAALVALAAVPAIAMYQRGLPVVERFVIRGNRQSVAALALVYGVADDEIIQRTVAPWPIHVWNLRGYLRASGHVPFDREWPLRLGEAAGAAVSDRLPAGLVGFVDRETELPGGFFRLAGWAFGAEKKVEEVLLIDRQGTVRGEVVTGLLRPDLVSTVHPGAGDAGWEGYAVVDPRGDGLRACARLAGDPVLYELPKIPELAR